MATSTVGETQVFSPARRWTRYKLDVPVRVITHRSSTSSVINGRGKDISEGGMAVFAGVELSLGERIEIEFTPPYGLPIRVQGLVRNRSEYRYGVEFVAFSERQQEAVTRLKDVLRAAVNLE
jgi:c-di-GMP-binding flagellar brake protein YcgR